MSAGNSNTSAPAAPPKKILIVLFGAIGDVIRALPLAMRIKAAWPESSLSWAIEPASKALLGGHPAVDKILLFDRPRGAKEALRFLRALPAEKFDLVLDLQRHLKSGLTSFSTRAPRRLGFNPRNAKEFNWLFNTGFIPAVKNFSLKIEHYQLFGDLLGIPRLEPLRFGLDPAPEQIGQIERRLQQAAGEQQAALAAASRRVALILGSSWKSRWWPVEYYVETVRKLAELGVVSVLVGGKGEIRIAQEIAAALGADRTSAINFAGQTDLRELAALFANMAAAAGPDSGPMHLAAAVGLPVVSLWGSTSPLRSAPYGSGHTVLQSAIGCSPCYERDCPGLNNLCMRSLPAQAVVAAVSAALASRRP